MYYINLTTMSSLASYFISILLEREATYRMWGQSLETGIEDVGGEEGEVGENF